MDRRCQHSRDKDNQSFSRKRIPNAKKHSRLIRPGELSFVSLRLGRRMIRRAMRKQKTDPATNKSLQRSVTPLAPLGSGRPHLLEEQGDVSSQASTHPLIRLVIDYVYVHLTAGRRRVITIYEYAYSGKNTLRQVRISVQLFREKERSDCCWRLFRVRAGFRRASKDPSGLGASGNHPSRRVPSHLTRPPCHFEARLLRREISPLLPVRLFAPPQVTTWRLTHPESPVSSHHCIFSGLVLNSSGATPWHLRSRQGKGALPPGQV